MEINRGFKYGDGFFETVRIHEGKVPLLRHHLGRIRQAAEVLNIGIDSTSLKVSFERSLLEHNQFKPEGVVRVSIHRGGSGTYAPTSNQAVFTYEAKSISSDGNPFLFSAAQWDAALVNEPLPEVHLGVYPILKTDGYPWSSFKTLSSMFYVQSAIWANSQSGIDEALILGSEGLVLETGTSNVLLFHEGNWKAPKWGSGQVKGVYLTFLNEFLNIEFTDITLEMLIEAEHFLVCNAAKGVRRVTKLIEPK